MQHSAPLMMANHVTAIFVFLIVPDVYGASLRRSATQLHTPAHLAPRPCKVPRASLLEGASGAARSASVQIYADGYSRAACEVDISPESQRIHFKDHVCGAVKTCRLSETPMKPRLCFDFCRTFKEALFFGIVGGTDCYCAKYFHASSKGGEGTCSFHCEGDNKEMCGGPDKSSLFEMHHCGDSADEASFALQLSEEALSASSAAVEAGLAVFLKLCALAKAMATVNVCAVTPEGPRVCKLPGVLLEMSGKVQDAVSKAELASAVLAAEETHLQNSSTAVSKSADNVLATLASQMEISTQIVTTKAAAAQGVTKLAEVTINATAGPLGGEGLAEFKKAFKPLGDVNASWHAICALEPISGESYAAVTKDDPSKCAGHCLSKSTGTDACVAFNYQYKDGLAACQLLKAEGLVQPMIAKAVPIFEVSQSKLHSWNMTSFGCYAHWAFLGGHPQGPLGTKVVREVVAE